MEQIETELLKYNIDTIVDGDSTSVANAIKDLVTRGILDNFMASDGSFTTDISKLATVPVMKEDGSWSGKFKYVVGKDQYTFSVYQNEDGTFTSEESDIIAGEGASGGEVTGGTTLVTKDTFTSSDEGATDASQKGKYTINGDANVIFTDELEGEYSIYVKSGATATISIFKNMTLSNTGLKRSAIDIEPGGTLNLWVAEGAEVIVNSGFATPATIGKPGAGAYAGIRVPWTDSNNNNTRDNGESGTLNLSGKGTLKAYGGDASVGETQTTSDYVSGGGGAGAGIGGNGGDGGLGQSGISENGKQGESAGIISIDKDITIYAYGGAGSSGTPGYGENSGAGGGYPAAGIGGGGAGAGGSSCCSGSGGYSAGGSDLTCYVYTRKNIVNGGVPPSYTIGASGVTYWGTMGSGYYVSGQLPNDPNLSIGNTISASLDNNITGLGGLGGCGASMKHLAGNGGQAGQGGIITTSRQANIYAFNGSRYTDGTSYNEGRNEAPIYAQLGIRLEKYKWQIVSGGVGLTKVTSQSTIPTLSSKYTNTIMQGQTITINNKVSFLKNIDLSHQGIGSGAGYTEISNGEMYLVD